MLWLALRWSNMTINIPYNISLSYIIIMVYHSLLSLSLSWSLSWSLSYYHTIILSYYHIIILSYYHTIILLYYHIIILSYCHIIMLSLYDIGIAEYCGLVLLVCWRSFWNGLQHWYMTSLNVGGCAQPWHWVPLRLSSILDDTGNSSIFSII